jgi:hypothetical protein
LTKAFSLALFAWGIVFLLLGVNAYQSTSSDLSRFFAGAANDKSMWMLAGGGIATLLGLAGLTRGAKKVPETH